ncbi:MAG: hypothetical protein HWD61_03055 [Parachlamydiaceae bacterium]|nr:MAG: hypothetical protein HWD61_03055 [Parachlamydiaceae bacterium]
METKVVVGTEQGNVYLFQANLNTFIPLPSMGETDTIKHITATKNHYLIAQREMISVINIDNLATEKIVKHPSHMEVSYMKMNRERLVVVYDDKQIKTYLDK